MITVLLADDHPVVRAGLRAVLETDGGITVAAEAATPDEAVQAVHTAFGLDSSEGEAVVYGGTGR